MARFCSECSQCLRPGLVFPFCHASFCSMAGVEFEVQFGQELAEASSPFAGPSRYRERGQRARRGGPASRRSTRLVAASMVEAERDERNRLSLYETPLDAAPVTSPEMVEELEWAQGWTQETCYLLLVKEEYRAEVFEQLGIKPFGHLLACLPGRVIDFSRLSSLRLSFVGRRRLHVEVGEAGLGYVSLASIRDTRQFRDFFQSYAVWTFGSGPGASKVIATAGSTNAASMGTTEANKKFMAEVKALPKVDVLLTEEQQRTFCKVTGVEPIFAPTRDVTHDHPEMVVVRKWQTEQTLSAVLAQQGKVLAVGCGGMELQRFSADPRFGLHFHGSEAKDAGRSLHTLAAEACRRWKKGLSAGERAQLGAQTTHSRRKLRFDQIMEMANVLSEGKKAEDAALFVGDYPRGFDSVVAFDSAYNMGRAGIEEIFLKTGCSAMFGTMFMPYELLWRDVPDHPWYVYREVRGLDGRKYSEVGFRGSRGGSSNGYRHLKSSWVAILEAPSMFFPSSGLRLVVEVTSWRGPMMSFKISKTDQSETITRCLTLPDYHRYVRILDLEKSTTDSSGRLVGLEYFSVCEVGVEGLLSYLHGLKSTELTPLAAIGYIRRHKNGIEMATKTFEDSWRMPDSKVFALAVVAVAIVAGAHAQVDDIVSGTASFTKRTANWKKIVGFFAKSAAVILSLGLVIPAEMLWRWLTEDSLTDKLMLRPEFELWQHGTVLSAKTVELMTGVPYEYKKPDVTVDLREVVEVPKDEEVQEADEVAEECEKMVGEVFAPHPLSGTIEGEKEDCFVCSRVSGRLGKQVVRCTHVENTNVDWSMSAEEVVQWKNELYEASRCAPNAALHKTIMQAHDAVAEGPWELNLETLLIEAGPGTGKSHTMRMIYDDECIVFAPFGKLRVDYLRQPDGKGGLRDLVFKTTHQGMYFMGAKETILVDEASAMDRRAVAMMARNVGAKRIVLVGDRLQTGLLPSEGEGIFSWNDMSSVSRHELRMYFRGTAWTCALLNLYYGYDMIAANGGFEAPTFGDMAEFNNEATERVSINFTADTASTFYASGQSNSVRANQGSTHDHVGIVLGDADCSLIQNEQLFRVAVSRHRESIKVYSVEGCQALNTMKIAYHTEDERLWAGDEAYVSKAAGRSLLPKDEASRMNVVRAVVAGKVVRKVYEKTDATNWAAGVFGTALGELSEKPKGVATVDLSELAEVEGAFSEEQLTELWELDFPGFGPIRGAESEDYRDLAASKRTFPAGLSLDEYYRLQANYGWCSLVAVLRCVGGSYAVGLEFIAHAYNCYRAGTHHGSDGVSLTVIADFFTSRNVPVATVERMSCDKEDVQIRLYAPADKVVVPEEVNVFELEPSHIEWRKGIVDMVSAEVAVELVDRDGVVKKQKVFTNVLDAVRRTGASAAPVLYIPSVSGGVVQYWSKASRVVRGIPADPKPLDKAVVMTMEEAKYLEMMEFGPLLPSSTYVDEVVDKHAIIYEGMTYPRGYEYRPSWDAYREAGMFDGLEGLVDVKRAANEEAAVAGMLSEARNGKMDAEFRNRLTKNRGIKRDPAPTRALGLGAGNYFFAYDAAQALQSGVGRYLKTGVSTAKDVTEQGRMLAKEMVDWFFFKCMKPELEIDEAAEETVWMEWVKAARRKNYVGRAQKEPEEYRNTVRYFTKNQYKPAKFSEGKLKIAHDKVGQGISSWSAEAVATCGGHIRIANHRFLTNLLDHVVYDNKVTEQALAAHVLEAVKQLPVGASSITTDVVEMDSIQDVFTQEIERQVLARLGFTDKFVEYYYSYRRNYPLFCQGVFSAKGGTEKTSGEPGTLLFNSVLSSVFACYIIRFDGDFVMAIKGDDNTIWCVNPKISEEHYGHVKVQSRYRCVASFGDAEFCGKVVLEEGMFPNTARMLSKAFAQRYRSKEHFHQWQISARDKVRLVRDVGETQTLAATAVTTKSSWSTVCAQWDAFLSITHLSWEQFMDVSFRLTAPTGVVGLFD